MVRSNMVARFEKIISMILSIQVHEWNQSDQLTPGNLNRLPPRLIVLNNGFI